MEILKRVIKTSVFIVVPAALASAFLFEPRNVPLGIVTGWLLGIINLRQLTRNVEGLMGKEQMTARLVILSMFRLLALFAAIFLLIYYRVANVLGLLFGFSIVFLFILVEGMKVGKSQ